VELTLEPETEADPKTRPWSVLKLCVEETEGRGKGSPRFSSESAAEGAKSRVARGEFRTWRASSKLLLGLVLGLMKLK